MTNTRPVEAEIEAVTKPSVAPGLGFPLDRTEISPEPTGWQVPAASNGTAERI